ncbi:unnamed protein product [Phyllotreta striolata]|uniref:Uncharacterized protein n=1 Tax=Phyllotreta striolata TaxID=444603 RepID=A0A9N9TG33_PHYSR|nr:unnamed protein product [Phyllotreta striolata]
MGMLLYYFILASFSGALGLSQPICILDTADRMNLVCKNVANVFPTDMYYGNKNLQCENCDIKVFSLSTFPHENVLLSLNISHTNLQAVDESAFSHLGNLRNIYFEFNKIDRVSSKAFKGLRQVYEINLRNNEIKDLIPGFIEDLEVSYFSLSHNKIEEIPNNVFKGTLVVANLILSHNKIKNIHYDSFTGLEATEYLEIDHNELCYIPIGAFRNLKELKYLNLASNKLSKFSLGTFSGLTALYSLILANNSLETFEGDELLPMHDLNRLDLKGNRLFYLDAHLIYTSAPTLKHVSFEGNVFSCLLLKNVIRYLKAQKVKIETHSGNYDVQNINGIACIEGPVDELTTKEFFFDKAKEEAEMSVRYNSYC